MIDTNTALDLSKLDRDYVAVVQLKTQPKGVLHQVTLRKDKIHPDSQLIRLGETVGDEANGWLDPENVFVRAVLGAASIGDKTVNVEPLEKAA